MQANRGKTQVRDQHRRTLKARREPCGICKMPIDYSLPHLDRQAFVADHIIPLAKGGPDTLENKQSAHRSCNESKGAKIGYNPETKGKHDPIKRVREY